MSHEIQTKPKAIGKPYDVWSISCAVVALLCWLFATDIKQGMEPSNVIQSGYPFRNATSAKQALLFSMLSLRVASAAGLITGVAGWFQFRMSRAVALVGVLISAPFVLLFIIQAIQTAQGY